MTTQRIVKTTKNISHIKKTEKVKEKMGLLESKEQWDRIEYNDISNHIRYK